MLKYILLVRCGCGGTGRRAGLRNQCQRRGGSSPLIRTNDVSILTKRIDRYKYHSEMDGIFLLQKYQLELKTDGIDKLKKDLSSKDKIIDKLQAKKEKIKQELQKIKDFWYGNMEYFHKKNYYDKDESYNFV